MNYPKVKQLWQRIVHPSTRTEYMAAVEPKPLSGQPFAATGWPAPKDFLDLTKIPQLTDGCVRCTGVAICDEAGQPVQVFQQGQAAHFFIEFEVLEEIGIPAAELEFQDVNLLTVYGKNSFQFDLLATPPVKLGVRLRYHQVVNLDIHLGLYFFSVGLVSSDEAAYERYRQGEIGYEEFQQSIRSHCRLVNTGSFEVGPALQGKLRHHGIVNLPSQYQLTVEQPRGIKPAPPRPPEPASPTIFHITHYKAGSQWIHKILLECIPEYIVPPQTGNVQFLKWPPQPGKIYPTVYITREQFYSVPLPPNWRHFVVIRDLRDALISGYFSMKVSHRVEESLMAYTRSYLDSVSVEDGLLYLMSSWLVASVQIQLSWLQGGEPLIRYEDLLQDDLGILERVLLDQCELPVSREKFRQAVLANRFESLTKGRQRGEEDTTAHERKGVAGDWQNYFTDRVKQAFKAHYGGLLVATGYEKDLNW